MYYMIFVAVNPSKQAKWVQRNVCDTGCVWKPFLFSIICIQYFVRWILPSGKLIWQWKMDQLKMYFLLKMAIFHCHVSLLEGTPQNDCTQTPCPGKLLGRRRHWKYTSHITRSGPSAFPSEGSIRLVCILLLAKPLDGLDHNLAGLAFLTRQWDGWDGSDGGKI